MTEDETVLHTAIRDDGEVPGKSYSANHRGRKLVLWARAEARAEEDAQTAIPFLLVSDRDALRRAVDPQYLPEGQTLFFLYCHPLLSLRHAFLHLNPVLFTTPARKQARLLLSRIDFV